MDNVDESNTNFNLLFIYAECHRRSSNFLILFKRLYAADSHFVHFCIAIMRGSFVFSRLLPHSSLSIPSLPDAVLLCCLPTILVHLNMVCRRRAGVPNHVFLTQKWTKLKKFWTNHNFSTSLDQSLSRSMFGPSWTKCRFCSRKSLVFRILLYYYYSIIRLFLLYSIVLRILISNNKVGFVLRPFNKDSST